MGVWGAGVSLVLLFMNQQLPHPPLSAGQRPVISKFPECNSAQLTQMSHHPRLTAWPRRVFGTLSGVPPEVRSGGQQLQAVWVLSEIAAPGYGGAQ